MALSNARDTQQYGLGEPTEFELPVAASTTIYQGGLVCDNGSGYITKGAAATTLLAFGTALETVDNSAGSAGDKKVKCRRGAFWFKNSTSTDEIVLADRLSQCFIVDDEQVAKTNGTNTRSGAGIVLDVDATRGVLVYVTPRTAL